LRPTWRSLKRKLERVRRVAHDCRMPRRFLCAFACGAVTIIAAAGSAGAAASITVTPHDNLTNGQQVTVSGSGFQQGPGAILECNPTPGEPTIQVAGSPVPVGCTNPLDHLITVDSSGNVPPTQFPVKTGTVGPPASGTDSAGNDAAADAAKYPCPPTPAQQANNPAGTKDCVIAVGDSKQPPNQATQAITFQATTTTTAATATTVATTATTVATTTAVTNPPVLQGTTATTAPAQLGRTGSSQRLLFLAIGGVIVLDAGYLLFSSTRRPRLLFRRRT